ncbi:MAG: glycogen/starch synthase, partial [Bacteroidaceae bacterium]|nr:glycogen/starch synthase [Bacteroidaceae bacterium]
FQQRLMASDEEGKEYSDNDERTIFYARGVLETVKKLRWCPDIIHCHGWMTSLVPLYVKTAYKEEPSFRDSKIIFSLYENGFQANFNENFLNQTIIKDMKPEMLQGINQPVNFEELTKLAINYSDGIIQNAPDTNPALLQYAEEKGLPILPYQGEKDYADAFNAFYDTVWDNSQEETK